MKNIIIDAGGRNVAIQILTDCDRGADAFIAAIVSKMPSNIVSPLVGSVYGARAKAEIEKGIKAYNKG
jgi:hypothetical protein